MNIKTNLEMIREITDFTLSEEINEHGRCVIKGIISDGSQDKLVMENQNGNRIRIFMENGTTLFEGMMDEISVFLDGDLYKAEIKLVSASYLMDIEKKSRSFQDKDQTYEEIIKQIAAEYDGGDLLDHISNEKAIGNLIVQYEETDWEFLKRLSSHFYAGILPDTQFDSPKIYFGFRKSSAAEEISCYSYTLEKNFSGYKQLTAEGHDGYLETDAASFHVTSRQYYKPGSCVKFRQMQLYIGNLEAKMDRGEVIFRYRLYTQKGLERPRIYAERLTGVSIGAQVIEAVKDKVRVKLEIDGQKTKNESVWKFPYQTMYTAGNEGGWYCMPESGDTVSIYFPDKKEENAVAQNSSRSGKNRDKATDDPSIKYFRTVDGKEIRFTKEAVIITCNDETTITLDENDGIAIESEKGITLRSSAGINIDAEESIEFYASDRIRLHCKKSQIQMDTMIDISGPDVRIN